MAAGSLKVKVKNLLLKAIVKEITIESESKDKGKLRFFSEAGAGWRSGS